MRVVIAMVVLIMIMVVVVGMIFVAVLLMIIMLFFGMVIVVVFFGLGMLLIVMIVVAMIFVILVFIIMMIIMGFVAMVIVIVSFEQHAFPELEQLCPVRFQKRRHRSVACQSFKIVFHPRGQVLTNPKNQIGLLQSGCFGRPKVVPMRRGTVLYNQIGLTNPLHYTCDE